MRSTPESSLLVGAIPGENQRGTVIEFFELFKIPWAFYDADRPADFGAVIACSSAGVVPDTSIVFVIGPQESPVDLTLNLKPVPLPPGASVNYGGKQVPIYTQAVTFEREAADTSPQTEDGRRLAVVIRRPEATFVRVGYDLFAEIAYLLSVGHSQVAHAVSPAVEIHIDFIRHTLLLLGMPVVEIPPSPHGHPFIVCLTHDIDFMGIRHHRLDHSFLGFVGRVLRSVFTARRDGWQKVTKNIAALVSLPAVYLKLKPDFWYPLDRYAEADGQLPSTYFFIPFAGRAGKAGSAKRPSLRAARYHVEEYVEDLRELETANCEVGVHGIDAWCDAEQGKLERQVIRGITGRDDLGVRMHWLYFEDRSPAILEQAGYTYDSTLGFNDAVGYRNGTSQVFRPQGTSTLLELPLNIQDTALLFPGRMHLSEVEALARCDGLIEEVRRFGGVLTINWHDRSLAPERNWNGVYARLLANLRANGPWFAQARQAVAWFRRRRSLVFTTAKVSGDRITVTVSCTDGGGDLWADDLPPPVLRLQTRPGGVPTRELAFRDVVSGASQTIDIDLAH